MVKRLTLAFLALALVVFAAACGGGGGDVPVGTVAVVDGTEISRAELDELVERAKSAYEAQKQEFPKVGTPEFQNVQTQYVAFLVQREEFEKEAEELGIEVAKKDVDREVEDFIESRYEGDRKAAEKALEEQGFTFEAFEETMRTSVLAQKLFDAVTKDLKVDEAEILAEYQRLVALNYQPVDRDDPASLRTPESRDVRHILISEKKKDGDAVDFAKRKAEANRIYAELKGGADFAALAKENSDDPSAKDNAGKLSISRGQTVPEFDKVAFELKQGAISQPVKTTYGYHIIEALSPVRESKTTPLAEVRASIRTTLLQERKTTFMTDWVEDLTKKYEGKVSYAAGFEPPDIPDETTTETDPS